MPIRCPLCPNRLRDFKTSSQEKVANKLTCSKGHLFTIQFSSWGIDRELVVGACPDNAAKKGDKFKIGEWMVEPCPVCGHDDSSHSSGIDAAVNMDTRKCMNCYVCEKNV